MAVTISVEETIAHHFDSFYKECGFQGIELSEGVKRLLHILEGDTITEATSEYTSEYHAAWDEGHQEGWLEGRDEGYDEGYYEGYAEAKAED
jgi:flagellar biosynthesis/type III secretory pathway protein FliH